MIHNQIYTEIDKMRLIDYTAEYLSLIDAMSYADDELQQEQIAALLDAIEEKRDDKLEKCAWVYREYLAEENALDAEIERLKTKKERATRNAEKLKNYIAFCLQGEKVKTKTFSFSFRKSESVEIMGEVPEQYQRVKTITEPDKALIKTDLKSGADLEFAKLVTKSNLQIK